jgi:hypothetical protein
MDALNAFISKTADALLGAFAILWAPLCVAVLLFFVAYALWPSNWKKFLPAATPDSAGGIRADRSSKQ